jgi:hypothetical protein
MRRDEEAYADEMEEALPLEPVEDTELGRQRSRFASRSYSAPAQLGPHMRLQAASGYRAGVIELRPGLFLVAEVPTQALAPEFGVAAVLAPMVVSAAAKALENPETQKAIVKTAEKGASAIARGLSKPKDHGQPKPRAERPPASHKTAPSARRPLALPPPQSETALVPWADEEDYAEALGARLPVWAAEEDLAGEYGCERGPCATCRWGCRP